MPPDERDCYPICLVACKSPNQPLSPEKGVQSLGTSPSHHSGPLKASGSLQDFSSQVGASGVIIDYEKGLVITTALPFAEFIPSKQASRNCNQSNCTSGLDNSRNHYSEHELKELSISVILQNLRANTRGKVNQSFHSTRQSAMNRHHPSTNKVFSALPQPSKSISSQIDSGATESFLVYDANVLLLWKCCSLDKEIKKLMPSADGWELDYGERQGEIGSSSHLMSKKDMTGGDEEEKKDTSQRNFLSWFALLQVDGGLQGLAQHPIKIIPTSILHLAQPVTACGTPFATLSPSVFYNSVSKGIITKQSGRDLIMTDARCMPGMEGGGLFVTDKKERYLTAMIISPLCWKANEWIGLSLACSMSAILDSLQQLTSVDLSRIRSSNYGSDSYGRGRKNLQNTEIDPKRFQSVVLLRVGTVWGSGVIVDEKEGLILTCRHVVKTANFNQGSRVYAVGFPLFDPSQSSTPSVTSGVMSKVIRIDQKPIMIQSTCAVHAGASGGALLCAKTGNLVGIIASNSRDRESGASFPHVNFSIPVECFKDAVQQYIITKDPAWLKDLEMTDERVTSAWALEENGTFIRRLPSKL